MITTRKKDLTLITTKKGPLTLTTTIKWTIGIENYEKKDHYH